MTAPGHSIQLANFGTALAGSPSISAVIADETEKWGKVIKFAGITPE